MLQAGIKTCPTLRQADDIPLDQACDLISVWELTHMYQISFAYILRYQMHTHTHTHTHLHIYIGGMNTGKERLHNHIS